MCVCLEKVFHERNLFKEVLNDIPYLFHSSNQGRRRLQNYSISFYHLFICPINEDDSEGCNLEISTILQ